MHAPHCPQGGRARTVHRFSQPVIVTCTADATLAGQPSTLSPDCEPLYVQKPIPHKKGEKRQIVANTLAPELLRHTNRLSQEQSRKSRWRRT
jgi:hypothetical protein